MADLRKYHFGDYTALKERGQAEKSMVVLAHLTGPMVHTVMIDGEVKAIAGLYEIAPHRAVAFAMIDPDIPLMSWRELLYAARELLNLYAQNYLRIEAFCRADWPQAIKFLSVLGFEQEGVLKDMLPDGDGIVWRYA